MRSIFLPLDVALSSSRELVVDLLVDHLNAQNAPNALISTPMKIITAGGVMFSSQLSTLLFST